MCRRIDSDIPIDLSQCEINLTNLITVISFVIIYNNINFYLTLNQIYSLLRYYTYLVFVVKSLSFNLYLNDYYYYYCVLYYLLKSVFLFNLQPFVTSKCQLKINNNQLHYATYICYLITDCRYYVLT